MVVGKKADEWFRLRLHSSPSVGLRAEGSVLIWSLVFIVGVVVCLNNFTKIQSRVTNKPLHVLCSRIQGLRKTEESILDGVIRKPVVIGNGSDSENLLVPIGNTFRFHGGQRDVDIHGQACGDDGPQIIMLPVSLSRNDSYGGRMNRNTGSLLRAQSRFPYQKRYAECVFYARGLK